MTTTAELPQCFRCIHQRYDSGWTEDGIEVGTCAAFPEGVPLPIWTNRVSHKKPRPGDGGIRFEPIPTS